MRNERSYCLTATKSFQGRDSDIDSSALTFKEPTDGDSQPNSPRILTDKIGPKINKVNTFQTLIKEKHCAFEEPICNDGDSLYFDSRAVQIDSVKSINDVDIENDECFNESLLSEGFNSTRD